MYSNLYILDCRGKVAATLNMAVGKGTEDVSFYPNTELIYCNIDNIHVMRSSAGMFADALASNQGPPGSAGAGTTKDTDSQQLLDGSLAGYHTRIEESGWLRHIRLVLMTSVVGAEKLHFEGASVLVHCSDGW